MRSTRSSGPKYRNCEGWTRRDCLQLGLAGGLASSLPQLLQMQAQAATPGPRKFTSCILVWLDGGPSHYETFDPKPDAPAEIRGELNPIKTSLPGVYFSEHMKELSRIADKLSIVRSIRHNQGNHGAGNHYMMTGAPTRIPVSCGAFVSFHPSLGSVTAIERGAPAGLPAYFSIPSMSRSGGPNFLGAKYAPFVVPDDPNSGSFRVRDVALPAGLEDTRFDRRRALRDQVDQLVRIPSKVSGDPVNALDEYYEQGYDLMNSKEAQAAFDINREPDKTREKFGRNSFGQRMLLARRLVQAGVPFVTIYNGGWDHHVDIYPRLKSQLPPLDLGVATLIEDLEERGMLDTTLVVVLGEFGRTPQINAKGDVTIGQTP